MALFSRKKSKAKKAEKQEDEKAAANAPKPAAAKPPKGRNGRPVATPSEPAIANIPAPSQLPRHYDDPSSGIGRFVRGGPEQPQDSNKYDNRDPYASADSGYGSAGPGSQLQSRNPSSHQLYQQRDYSVGLGNEWLSREPAFSNNQFMQDDLHDSADLALDSADNRLDRGPRPSKSLRASRNQHENDHAPEMHFQDRTPKHQDPRQQRKIQQSMPMRPSSVPPQALQSRSERVSRPPVHRSSSPGPELQRSHTMRSLPSRNSAPLNVGRPYGWFEQASSQLQFQQRSPTSPMRQDFEQDEPSPSMGILFGLKVNRRGLILDEEGDPIAELYEGDIIDCVRQRADAHGNVLDEYGRVVGRVRMLSSGNAEPILRPFTPKANEEDRSFTSPHPPMPNNKNGVEARSPGRNQPNSPQQVWTREDSPAEEQYPSPPRINGATSGRDNITETNKAMAASSDDISEFKDPPSPRNQEHSYVQEQEHSVPRLQTKSSFIKTPESLPSVPESDDNSRSADGMSEDRTEDEHRSVDEQTLRQDATPTKDSAADHAFAQSEQAVSQQVNLISTTQPLEAHDNSIAVAKPNRSSTSLAPSTGSNAEARALSVNGLPPVPALPKDLQGFKKTVLASERPVVVAHAQPITLQATPSRMKSPPLPSFPGRGLSSGSLAGSPFANAQMPGMPVRRLTTPGVSAPTPFGTAGMGAQPPAFRSRLSGTTPLVRSPLSSQENSPPESEQGSTAGDSRTAPQHQGHARSQSVKTTKSTGASAPGAGGRPRRTFAHANKAGADKDADVVVKEVADEGKKKAEKKKGIKGLFGGKKKA